jgi:ribosomal protein L37AE/L43A
MEVMKWLLRLFCKCDKRSLIGYTLDENLKVSSSIWRCDKCGKIHKTFEID